MTHHILNGDCLADHLKETNLNGDYIICREALIDGPIQSGNLETFWSARAAYIQETYHDNTENYFSRVVPEFLKIRSISPDAEVCLWFEHDLFCQVNMWFVMSLLYKDGIKRNISRVFPVVHDANDVWKGFGVADATMLEQAFAHRIILKDDDLKLGNDLWKAYCAHDFDALKELATSGSKAFKFLPEVCKAHIERFPEGNQWSRPERVLLELIDQSNGDFAEVFAAFSEREGIYGFGDLQVRIMYDRLRKQN